MKSVKLILLMLALSVTVLSSCEQKEKPLTTAERMATDSIYRKRMKVFRPFMDSICKTQRDSLIQIAMDSMLRERADDVERQLERLKKEELY